MKRYLEARIKDDLGSKMVFIGGSRQVEKTTLAVSFLGLEFPVRGAIPKAYINWDIVHDKETLIKGYLPAGEKIIILDEIHKYAHWRNLVKGFYDKYQSRTAFLITGSARLDYYARGGDSLHGRYHYYRLNANIKKRHWIHRCVTSEKNWMKSPCFIKFTCMVMATIGLT